MTCGSADIACPKNVLMTGTFRVGTKQPNNLYVVDADGNDYYVGALFRASYGEILIKRINRVAQ